MKNRRQTILASLCAIISLIGFASCEKELMDYEGVDAVYFDVQYGAEWGNENVWAHQYYTVVSFSNLEETTSYDVSLKVGVAGSVKDYDRTFQLEVVADSTTAIAPEEYDGLETTQIIKAGENNTRVRFTVNRSDRMLTDTLQIQLRLLPGEYFTVPFSEVGIIPGRWSDTQLAYSENSDPAIHNIFLTNVLTRPTGWNDLQFGTFSAQKYQLLMDVSGYSVADFEERAVMQTGRQLIIARVGSAYLMERYNMGREHWVIDSDGTMMWVRGVSWAQGTNPDDMLDI